MEVVLGQGGLTMAHRVDVEVYEARDRPPSAPSVRDKAYWRLPEEWEWLPGMILRGKARMATIH